MGLLKSYNLGAKCQSTGGVDSERSWSSGGRPGLLGAALDRNSVGACVRGRVRGRCGFAAGRIEATSRHPAH